MFAGEMYTAQWFDRAWLAVRSLETLLSRGGLQRRLQSLFSYSERKEPQIDVDEWLQTIENSETTLRGWCSIWVYGTVVPEVKSNFRLDKAKLSLAVQMDPPPNTESSGIPIVRIRVYERDSTYDHYIDISSEGYGLVLAKVLEKQKARKIKAPPPEGAFSFGASVFNQENAVMWLCTDPNKSWLARVCCPLTGICQRFVCLIVAASDQCDTN
jgi:hypothetical protein